MTHDELIEKVARALFEAIDENTYKSKEDGDAWGVVDGEVNFHELAQAAISTILAALQEPNANQEQSGMREIMGGTGYVNHEIYIDPETPWHTWRAMLAASALGEQSE